MYAVAPVTAITPPPTAYGMIRRVSDGEVLACSIAAFRERVIVTRLVRLLRWMAAG